MSGSNALAAAKRRRVDGASKPLTAPTPLSKPNMSQQRPQSQYQNQSQSQSKPTSIPVLPNGRSKTAISGNANHTSTFTDTTPTQKNVILRQNNDNNHQVSIQNNKVPEKVQEQSTNNIFIIPTPPKNVSQTEYDIASRVRRTNQDVDLLIEKEKQTPYIQ